MDEAASLVNDSDLQLASLVRSVPGGLTAARESSIFARPAQALLVVETSALDKARRQLTLTMARPLAAQALSFTGHAIAANPAVASTVVAKSLPPAVQLVSSALVQGTPLGRQLGKFFSALVLTKAEGASFDGLFAKLVEAGCDSLL